MAGRIRGGAETSGSIFPEESGRRARGLIVQEMWGPPEVRPELGGTVMLL